MKHVEILLSLLSTLFRMFLVFSTLKLKKKKSLKRVCWCSTLTCFWADASHVKPAIVPTLSWVMSLSTDAMVLLQDAAGVMVWISTHERATRVTAFSRSWDQCFDVTAASPAVILSWLWHLIRDGRGGRWCRKGADHNSSSAGSFSCYMRT